MPTRCRRMTSTRGFSANTQPSLSMDPRGLPVSHISSGGESAAMTSWTSPDVNRPDVDSRIVGHGEIGHAGARNPAVMDPARRTGCPPGVYRRFVEDCPILEGRV